MKVIPNSPIGRYLPMASEMESLDLMIANHPRLVRITFVV